MLSTAIDPGPAPHIAQDNIARSGQRGAADFRRAASNAAATPSQRLSAGIAAAGAPAAGVDEVGSGSGRNVLVRGAMGSYCLRLTDPSLKHDPFNKELAVARNCPP